MKNGANGCYIFRSSNLIRLSALAFSVDWTPYDMWETTKQSFGAENEYHVCCVLCALNRINALK